MAPSPPRHPRVHATDGTAAATHPHAPGKRFPRRLAIASLLALGLLATAIALAARLHGSPFTTLAPRVSPTSQEKTVDPTAHRRPIAQAASRPAATPDFPANHSASRPRLPSAFDAPRVRLQDSGRSLVHRSVISPTEFTRAQTTTLRPRNATPVPQAMPAATVAAPAIHNAHPRLLLDGATLAKLRAAAAANTPAWQALQATCDRYIGGTVDYPTGDQYPDAPDIGAGYQGEVYLPLLLAEGMCYQVLKTSKPSAAAVYGAKAVDILVKMSTPVTSGSGNLGQPPCNDDGYGIRNYGVGFGLGYDWVYELLTPAQRTQVYTTANAWLNAWEQPGGCADFVYVHPMSNYYAGYFHAKAVIALATYGENPAASAEWSDWYNNQFLGKVQPYYAVHLAGGGWPEGFGNYGTSGVLNMTLPMREVETATGADLAHGAAPFTYLRDMADYAMHFTWPSRAYFDDRDTNHANGNPTPPVGTPWSALFTQLLGGLDYWGSPQVAVFNQYFNEVRTATSDFNPADAWLQFLDDGSALPTAPVDTLPRSYLARGMGMVAARSDWTTGASWMSFRAGPYTENPAQGEEGFDQGSLALARGNAPLLVNTFGWMVHEPNGAADENRLYDDLFASFDNTQYHGNRQIYNIFYVRDMRGNTLQERFGQAAYTTEDDHVTTRVSAFEDGGDYVFVQATGLADMYRPFATGPAVSSWTRQIVFLRPNRFVVYDRSTAGNAAWDEYMAWHFPANPARVNAATGQNRLDVTYAGQYVGAMTTVLPANARLTTVPLYPDSNPTKVWQVQERPVDTSASQQWLTVFDLSPSAAAVASATNVNVAQGNMVGVRLASGTDVSVVLESAAAVGTPVTGTIIYSVPASAAQHVITELAPASGYSIKVTSAGGTQTISVSPGGAFMSSANGVLAFDVSAGGAATPHNAVPPRCDPGMPAYPIAK